jgi:capsular polysaccharide biosynthesis protein
VFTEARRRLIDESNVRPAQRLIYLSRAKVDNRRIANEEAVEDAFRRLGFEVVHPEELTLSQQIEAFYGARVFAGFSGSGLHNCVFMAPGGRVIELGDWRSPTKGLASQALFESLAGQTNTFIPFVGGAVVDGRAAVDVSRLQNALPALLSAL